MSTVNYYGVAARNINEAKRHNFMLHFSRMLVLIIILVKVVVAKLTLIFLYGGLEAEMVVY